MGRNKVSPVLGLWGSKCGGMCRRPAQQQLARRSGAQERRKKKVRFGSHRCGVGWRLGTASPHRAGEFGRRKTFPVQGRRASGH